MDCTTETNSGAIPGLSLDKERHSLCRTWRFQSSFLTILDYIKRQIFQNKMVERLLVYSCISFSYSLCLKKKDLCGSVSSMRTCSRLQWRHEMTVPLLVAAGQLCWAATRSTVLRVHGVEAPRVQAAGPTSGRVSDIFILINVDPL